jgi:hypothetical protein
MLPIAGGSASAAGRRSAVIVRRYAPRNAYAHQVLGR